MSDIIHAHELVKRLWYVHGRGRRLILRAGRGAITHVVDVYLGLVK